MIKILNKVYKKDFSNFERKYKMRFNVFLIFNGVFLYKGCIDYMYL